MSIDVLGTFLPIDKIPFFDHAKERIGHSALQLKKKEKHSMKKIGLSILLFSLLAQAAFAKKKASSVNLIKYVEKVSKLTGQKYVYGKSLKGSITLTSNYKLTKDNADSTLSLILNENGYTRVPLQEDNSYRIINARDVRYTPTKIYIAGKDTLPNNDDYLMLIIDLKEVNSTEITRSFRPFMSRYGRIIDIKQKNRIIIQDTAKNARRMLTLTKSIDIPLTSKEREKNKERMKHKQELAKLNAKNCGNVHQELKDLRELVKGSLMNKK